MKWLYENQSPRLFGAENRLFVVLVDSTDMNQSWKMKRAFSLIEPKVNTYLDSFSENSLKKIEFTFNKKNIRKSCRHNLCRKRINGGKMVILHNPNSI